MIGTRTGARPEPAPRPTGTAPLAAEGGFQALAQGLGEAYLGAFALFLGAGGIVLGLVATLPTAATAAAQILAQRILARARGARVVMRRAWAVQAAGYGLLGASLLLGYPWSLAALIAISVGCWGVGGLAVPAWTALVSAVVPRGRIGWFFGLRGSMQQAGAVVAILGGGAVLGWLTLLGREGAGFALIFVAAGLSRLLGTVLLARVPDTHRAGPERRRPPHLLSLLESAKVRRLAIYLWLAHLATHVSSPFFVPYMIRDLEFPYLLVGGLMAVPAVVKVLTMRFWGRFADRVGPGPILRSTGWFVSVVPILWLCSGSPWWILMAQVYSGLVWGAFELAQASALLLATRGRERVVGLFNAADGAMLIAGSLLGGLIADWADAPGRYGFQAVFLISALMRLIPAVLLLWRVRGIGRPTWSHLKIPMRVWAVRPTRGFSLKPWDRAPEKEAARPPAAAPPGASSAAPSGAAPASPPAAASQAGSGPPGRPVAASRPRHCAFRALSPTIRRAGREGAMGHGDTGSR
ncbi:MAG: MFS transporter, partial [Candidatus Polarisedimenticolia bacterium]